MCYAEGEGTETPFDQQHPFDADFPGSHVNKEGIDLIIYKLYGYKI